MILCLEITYGRFLKDTKKMFRDFEEKHDVAISRKLTPEHVIKIEDKTDETSSERKDEINTIDINNKLQLNNIKKEKVIFISDDDRNTYKKYITLILMWKTFSHYHEIFIWIYKNNYMKRKLLIYLVMKT
jgi:hypothetical protein